MCVKRVNAKHVLLVGKQFDFIFVVFTPLLTTPVKQEQTATDIFKSFTTQKLALQAKRLQAYQEKKSKKPAIIAKSSIVLDVKPWDDETDMGEVEKMVRGIELDGLVWGASKLVAIG